MASGIHGDDLPFLDTTLGQIKKTLTFYLELLLYLDIYCSFSKSQIGLDHTTTGGFETYILLILLSEEITLEK